MCYNFTFLKEVIFTPDFDIPRECWISSRSQFNAECLFDYAVKQASNGIVLMIISKDIYIRDLNYVFGIGVPNRGSVISNFRLDNNIESLYKIILHEIGHVFGLNHCRLQCSMAPSNSIDDIHHIQSSYCFICKSKLKEWNKKSSK